MVDIADVIGVSPTQYNFISLGAGVQSSCMSLMAAHGLIKPTPTHALFSDTHAEPKAVYDWLDYLETLLPFPIVRVSAGSLKERELTLKVSGKTGKLYRKSAIPAFVRKSDGTTAIVARKCTTDFKVIPLTRKVRELAKIKRGQKELTVTQWLGISYDEMQRMKQLKEPWNQARWPLIEMQMRRHDCINWMKQNGYPEPPRSACTFCPFHSNAEWRKLKQNKEEWEEVVQFEKDMQKAALGVDKSIALHSVPYLHSDGVPIDKVDLRTDVEKGQQVWNFMAECEGLCGV